MKTTRNIKKIFALIMAVVMCMSITATAFAIEPQQNDMMENTEVNEQIARVGHSLRFTYPETGLIRTTVQFNNLRVKVNTSGSGEAIIQFVSHKDYHNNRERTVKTNTEVTINNFDLEADDTYTVNVFSEKEIKSASFYLWS